MEKKKCLVVYHANCADGFTAAWLMSKYATIRPEWEFVYHAAIYTETEPAPLLADENAGDNFAAVYMVDFSYKRPHLDAMMEKYPNVVFSLIDHHKTAMEALLDKPGLRCICDASMCGASNVYGYIRNQTSWADKFLMAQVGEVLDQAWFVPYVNDRDLWLKALPMTEEINAYIGSLEKTFDNWDKLLTMTPDQAAAIGENLLAYKRGIVAGLCKGHQVVSIFGYENVPVVNTSGAFASDTADALSKMYPDAPMTLTYHFAHGSPLFSLRSPETGVDVSEVAKRFGGGGHMHAAGCSISQDSPHYFPTLKALKILPSQE